MAFIHKEITMAVRTEDKLNGIRIDGYIGCVHDLGLAVLEHSSNTVSIAEALKAKGYTYDTLVEYHDVHYKKDAEEEVILVKKEAKFAAQ